jgi:SAM-dependent methyltransferase
MLSHAVGPAQVSYVEARAEQLPFDDGTFDLVTVALALHWFDQQQFMLEARRVLRQGGWLVIYHDGFTGRMKGSSNFEKWNIEHYLRRYPPPPRNIQTFNETDAAAYGFVPSGLDEFIHEEQFTPDQLVSYLVTQTNVIAAVEAGSESLQSVAEWLLNSTRPLFAGAKEGFLFSCRIQFFKRR